jgi:endonuclease-8
MPEGDTIFRAARTLHRALVGKPVVRFESVFPGLTRVHEDHPVTGRTVDRVYSLGKHLLVQFSRDLVLRTHMRMNGSWHIYRPGEPWKRSRRDMRVLVATADFEAVGFNIPVAELLSGRDLERHRELRHLGPDLLGETFDAALAFDRARARPAAEIGDALLNQRVMAGVGNVYKSEVLFACGVGPFTQVAAVTDDELRKLIDTARKFLLANVHTGLAPMTTYTGYRRTTRRDDPAERLWVYGRARLPCRRCGTPILVKAQGTDARLTYWCPGCQADRRQKTEDRKQKTRR